MEEEGVPLLLLRWQESRDPLVAIAIGDSLANDASKDKATRWRDAFQWYQKAEGTAEGCFKLGRAYELVKDKAEAMRFFFAAAQMGHVEAMFRLGVCCEEGVVRVSVTGCATGTAEAVKWYRRAHELGHNDAAINLAQIYQAGKGTVEADPLEVIRLYRVAGQRGSASAWNYLGLLYLNGSVGLERSVKEAVACLEKAIALGDVDALYNLGDVLLEMEGDPSSQTEGVRLLKQAAAQGEVCSMEALGHCYWHGIGVTKDVKQAYDWYLQAAERCYPRALQAIGRYYLYGHEPVAMDKQKALDYFRRAIHVDEEDEGKPGYEKDDEALYILGWCYEKGEGVDRDDEEALKYYKEAAALGNATALRKVATFESMQTPRQGRQGQRLLDLLKSTEGDPAGFLLLATLYAYGKGVPMDIDKAERMLRTVQTKGLCEASFMLGRLVAEGRICIEELPDFGILLQDVVTHAETENSAACFSLALLYEKGAGVEWSPEKAEQLLSIAAKATNVTGEALFRLGYKQMGQDKKLERLKQAASLKYEPARYMLASQYLLSPDTWAKAYKWLLPLAMKGDAGPMFVCGLIDHATDNTADAYNLMIGAAARGVFVAEEHELIQTDRPHGELVDLAALSTGSKVVALPKHNLTVVPLELCLFGNIKVLDLSFNQLQTLPPFLLTMQTLRVLRLGNNRLTELPDGIGNLLHLKILNVCKNQLATLPLAIGRLERLKQIFTHGNPWKAPLSNFISRLTPAGLRLILNGWEEGFVYNSIPCTGLLLSDLIRIDEDGTSTYKGLWNAKPCAIKFFPGIGKEKDPRENENWIRYCKELGFMMHIQEKRRSTIRLYTAHASEKRLFIVTELGQSDSLYTYLQKQSTTSSFSFEWKRRLIMNLLLTLKSFWDPDEIRFDHPQVLVHGDINIHNIVMINEDRLAVKFKNFWNSEAWSFLRGPWEDPSVVVDTPSLYFPTQSPKYVQQGILSPAADLYSIGIVAYQIWTDTWDMTHVGIPIEQAIEDGIIKPPDLPSRMPSPIKEFLAGCWTNPPRELFPLYAILRDISSHVLCNIFAPHNLHDNHNHNDNNHSNSGNCNPRLRAQVLLTCPTSRSANRDFLAALARHIDVTAGMRIKRAGGTQPIWNRNKLWKILTHGDILAVSPLTR